MAMHKAIIRDAAEQIEYLVSGESELGIAPATDRTRLGYMSHIASVLAGQRHQRARKILAAWPSVGKRISVQGFEVCLNDPAAFTKE